MKDLPIAQPAVSFLSVREHPVQKTSELVSKIAKKQIVGDHEPVAGLAFLKRYRFNKISKNKKQYEPR